MTHSIHRSAALLAALLTACSGKEAGQPGAQAPVAVAGPNVVTITATEYAFQMPAQVPAGPTTFLLKSQGKELHHAVVVRLDEGKSAADLGAALKNPGPPPSWMHLQGGPNPPNPGGESNATLDLKPGHYVVLCFIPSGDGVPHFAKGMVTPFEVTAAPGAAAAAMPAPDVIVRMTEYGYTLSTPLKAGRQTIRVINEGKQAHEVALARFAPGKGVPDLVAWEQGGAKGPPPGSLLGGTSPMEPGDTAQFTVALEPGDYVLACFVPDAGDGKAHLAHGMAQPVKIS